MVIVVKEPRAFIVQIKDDKQRRIVLDKDAWDDEELEKGDYIEVMIRKLKLTGRER